jgi:hypothetical protein
MNNREYREKYPGVVVVPVRTIFFDPKDVSILKRRSMLKDWHKRMKEIGLEDFQLHDSEGRALDVYRLPTRTERRAGMHARKERSDGTRFTKRPSKRLRVKPTRRISRGRLKAAT